MFNLSITLIVPSKTQNGTPLDLEANALECKLAMAKLFGGSTQTARFHGAYVMQNGALEGTVMEEDVMQVTSFCEEETSLVEFMKFVYFIKQKYNQESVAYIENNEMKFL